MNNFPFISMNFHDFTIKINFKVKIKHKLTFFLKLNLDAA